MPESNNASNATPEAPLAGALSPDSNTGAPLDAMTLRDVEGMLIRRAMARYEGNVSHAARALGLSRSALYRRLERHGL